MTKGTSLIESQHHHLLHCLEKTTVSSNTILFHLPRSLCLAQASCGKDARSVDIQTMAEGAGAQAPRNAFIKKKVITVQRDKDVIICYSSHLHQYKVHSRLLSEVHLKANNFSRGLGKSYKQGVHQFLQCC